MIVATCGHELTEEEGLGIAVKYSSETCDAVEGFIPCTIYASLCAACVPEYRSWYPDLEILS